MKARHALLAATLGVGLTLTLVLWAKMPGGEKVALAAPTEQEPGCAIDAEGKTPDEVLAELEACLAQSGGIGALQAGTPLTITKSVTPTSVGVDDIVTYTISVRNDGSDFRMFSWEDQIFSQNDWAMQYVSPSLSTTGPGTASISGTAPLVYGYGWLDPDESVDFSFRAEITTCQSYYVSNTVEALDLLSSEYFSDTVDDLALESVTFTKTGESKGRVMPSNTITYTIAIDNYGCENIGVIIADDLLTNTGLCFDWSKGLGTGWWVNVTGGGVFSDTGTNYQGTNTFTTPLGTVEKTDFLHWEAYISQTTMVMLTIPVTVCEDYEGDVVTNTAEVWLWDEWWEPPDEPSWWPDGTQQFDIIATNQVGEGIFLPILMKNYSPP